jgi:endo-1,4-beta-D-glucanase Y
MGRWTFRSGVRLAPVACLLLLSVAGGCKQDSWPLWNAYAGRFIDTQGRVFDPKSDRHTTSEGQAYALFFALAANDRARFDRVLSWTQANLAMGDLETHLPAWLWGRNKDGKWVALDANSAADADVWMAYSLIEAGRLWNDKVYAFLGQKMLDQIAQNEVVNLPGFGPMLMPGSSGFKHGQSYILNPSYLPCFAFERFASVDPHGPWRQIAAGIPRLLAGSARHGFAMDWVEYFPGDGFYPAAAPQPNAQTAKDSSGPGGGYDAIRVYLWAGMQNARDEKRSKLVNSVAAMNSYLSNHDAPPESVSALGVPSATVGPVGFSAALLPYLRAFPERSAISAQQLIRMSLMKDESTGLYGKDLAYYDQNLALFGTGFVDGRFQFGTRGELKVEWKGQ